MNHAIKIESLDKPQEYWDKVGELVKEFLIDELNFTDNRVQEIECRSRDGFMPYSSNKGGYQAHSYGSQLDAYFEPTDFEEYDKLCVETYDEKLKDALKENNLTQEVYDKGISNDDKDILAIREEFEQYCSDYDSSAIQAMFKIENDTTIYFYVGIGGRDAPYFRSFESSFDHEITFDSIEELETKLETLTECEKVRRIQYANEMKFS